MGSWLFKILEYKATNDDTKNNVVFVNSHGGLITYEKLYKMTQEKIKLLKNTNEKSFYLLGFNDTHSISSLIALLEVGITPIILNGNQIKKDINYLSFDPRTIFISMLKSTLQKVFHIIDDYYVQISDDEKLKEVIEKIENSEVINKPGPGMIGIATSGTISNPKLVYLSEETLIRKVFESNYVNEDRIIYNMAPLSSISGLFTNVFAPIVSNNTKALFSGEFSPEAAINSTDLYLPRNYTDVFNNDTPLENKRIKRIFTYGEQNSFPIFDFIREKIKGLPQNVFVIVFGTTECGGLVSEIEEKDMQELHIYNLDIDKDMIIYSFDDKTIYKKIGNTVTILDEKEKQEYSVDNITKYLPSGFISNKIKIKNNNCIGEFLVDDFNTGDIITIIDDKFYVIGRKSDLDKNHYIANYDNELSILLNRKCATFMDKDNNLCVAISFSFLKEYLNYPDKTTYFKKFIEEAKTIRELIKDKYPNIQKTFFYTSNKFLLSEGIKKTKRNELIKYIGYGEAINYRIDNFREVLKNHIDNCFLESLSYIPNYIIQDDNSILISKKDISMTRIVDLLNELRIVAIEEDSKYYKLIYNDYYFIFNQQLQSKKEYNFMVNQDLQLREDSYPIFRRYDDEKLEEYRKYAQYGLLPQRLAVDNHIASLNIKDDHIALYNTIRNTEIYGLVFTKKNGDTIFMPYYAIDSTIKEYPDLKAIESNKQKAFNIINKKYKNINISEVKMTAPIPTKERKDDYDFLFDNILLGSQKYFIIDINDMKGFIHKTIRNVCWYNQDNTQKVLIK